MKIIAIVLARLDSNRLPNKALKTVKGMTVINYIISRAKKIRGVNEVVLATTARDVDDELAEVVGSYGIDVFRGSTNDVALRMLECAKAYGASYFIRINGDSPFLDPILISEGVTYCKEKRYDFVTNIIGRTFPYGIAVEIINAERYGLIYKRMLNEACFEHPTKYLYENPEEFNIKIMTSEYPELNKARLVIDTPDDLNVFNKILDVLDCKALDVNYKEAAYIYLELIKGEGT